MNRVEMIAITGHTAKEWPATDPSFQARRKSSFRRQNSRGLSADMQLPLGAETPGGFDERMELPLEQEPFVS